jgi:hypothetical protein
MAGQRNRGHRQRVAVRVVVVGEHGDGDRRAGAGFRDVLIQANFGIDLDIVWARTATCSRQ